MERIGGRRDIPEDLKTPGHNVALSQSYLPQLLTRVLEPKTLSWTLTTLRSGLNSELLKPSF